jgi:hypothetical protein
MREDAPAARMTPANEGERAMKRTISYLEVEEIVYGARAVDRIEIAKTAKIAKNRRDGVHGNLQLSQSRKEKDAKSKRKPGASSCDLCVRCG